MESEQKTPYFCYLCEGTHSPLKDGSKCPTCGRIYCTESIDTMKETGASKCPFCGESDLSSFLSLFRDEKTKSYTTYEPTQQLGLKSEKELKQEGEQVEKRFQGIQIINDLNKGKIKHQMITRKGVRIKAVD